MSSRKKARAASRATPPLFADPEFAAWRDEIAELVASPHAHRVFAGEPEIAPWTARFRGGIDEAGLGPVLGPLAIGYSSFRAAPEREDLWRSLRTICTKRVDEDAERLVVADSKEVFTRDARGERRLERTALAFLASRAPRTGCPIDARRVLGALASELRSSPFAESDGAFASDEGVEPWCAHLERRVPAHSTRDEIDALAAALGEQMARADVELARIGARLVHVRDLNESFARTENKATTHWLATRRVILHLWHAHADEGLDLVVDRHGGRVYYAHLLAETFLSASIHVVSERPPLSEYVVIEKLEDRTSDARDPTSLGGTPSASEPRSPCAPRAPRSPHSIGEIERRTSDARDRAIGGDASAPREPLPRRMRIRFAERAESRAFAVALASCLAKYARETCMNAFNAYFDALQPGLRPTAGYTTDGWRWLSEAGPAIERSGLARAELVRER